ncbi:MAG: hypothetical protein MMC33_002467 [Icmadophila ericetorum]|nr:hypothetical protein [Icmadophila ericetorum]
MPSPAVIQLAKVYARLSFLLLLLLHPTDLHAPRSTLAWSLSFYPQPFLNIQRRSTSGSTLDFPVINVLGFLCYLISNSLLYYSSLIRSQYAYRNPVGLIPTVQLNDVAFAAHSVVLSMITCSMFRKSVWGFEQRRGERVSRGVWGIMCGVLVGVGWIAVLVMTRGGDGGRDPIGWAWIDAVYALGYGKLVITLVKYTPQAWSNYRRKSTVGWHIGQIILDVIGGVLSITQLLIDSSLQDDWSGLTGNPVKFGLGNVSLFFDAIFLIQHYWLYRNVAKVVDDEAANRLLSDYEGSPTR